MCNEQYVGAHSRSRRACATENILHFREARTSDSDQRGVTDRRDRGCSSSGKRTVRGASWRDFRSWILECKGVADAKWDALLNQWTKRFRMKNLGAEVCEVRRLAIGNFGDRAGVGYDAGIGGQHAVHVGPDDYLVRIERRAQDSRRIIRAAAAESCKDAFFIGADESSDHGNDPLLQQGMQTRFASRAGKV